MYKAETVQETEKSSSKIRRSEGKEKGNVQEKKLIDT